MSDELAARLVEEGHPELAQQLEQKRLAGELRDANRPISPSAQGATA